MKKKEESQILMLKKKNDAPERVEYRRGYTVPIEDPEKTYK